MSLSANGTAISTRPGELLLSASSDVVNDRISGVDTELGPVHPSVSTLYFESIN